MSEISALHAPLSGRVKRLLNRLNRGGIFKPSERKRQRLREKIIAIGPSALRTVLKHSRWEGWAYRDDVFEIMAELAGDPVDLFIAGLRDDDKEIRWSCCKWLRDKGEGQTKAIEPLIAHLRAHPREGDVTSALGAIGSEGGQPLVELIADESALLEARIEALIGFPYREVGEREVTTLRGILANPDLDASLREDVPALLKALGEDED